MGPSTKKLSLFLIKFLGLQNFLSREVWWFVMIIGVVGKANVGKSTFFKAATLAEVEIGDRPFVTIKPNHGTGYVKMDCACRDFKVKCNPRLGFCLEGKRFIPADLLDVAGLIPGAYQGAGLGNQFLDDLRQADVLIHVVDASGGTNLHGEKVEYFSHNPCEDVEFLEKEMNMWYFGIVKKGWDKFSRRVKQEELQIHKELAVQLSGLKAREEDVVDAIKKANAGEDPTKWSEEDLFKVSVSLRRRTKPMIIAANKMDVEGSEKNLEKLRKEFPDYLIVPCSADHELALREAAKHGLVSYVPGERDFSINGKISDAQSKALDKIKKFLGKWGNTGVQEVLDAAVFDFLKYVAIFPGGVNKLEDSKGRVLPDCFLLGEGSTALDFAYAIHTDIGKNFIRAIDVRTKRIIGKEHKLKNRDVVEIIVNK
jgi:ribosome-binding ATPase YchF (GTP1/OBG family)